MSRETSRWTYLHGSRPESAVIYDDDTKIHNHSDTNPARGQHGAFDLVRLHKFGHLDAEHREAPITDRPSYSAMVEWAHSLPEVRAELARAEFVDLGPLPEGVVNAPATSGDGAGKEPAAGSRFQVYSASEFGTGAPLEWFVRGVLPRAELAVLFGESGSGKSFLALDLCAAISRGVEWRGCRTRKGRVVYVCAEGSRGFKARLRAYADAHKISMDELPAVIPDAPNLLDPKDAAKIAEQILKFDWDKRK